MKILYLSADLRNVGPTRQTLNIIKYSGVKENCVVLTLFEEPDETLIDEYRKDGIPVKCLSLSRKFFFLNGVSKIVEFCKENSIECIHSNGVKPDIIAHFAAKKANVKHVITLRNFPMEDLSGRMFPWIGKTIAQFHLFALKRCMYLVACSKTIADKMRKAYGVNITAIQNGVDTEKFQCQKTQSRNDLYSQFVLNESTKLFICTNSFIPRKHNDEIADAFIQAKLENVALVFLGDGPLLNDIKEKFKDCSNILFLGKQKNVAAYLQNADFFISASDSEGLPNAVIESLACGCPVILSDIPQHREILDVMPSCGLLYPLHDGEALKACLKQCMSKSFADSNAAISQSPFTMQKMGESYKMYYEKVRNNVF
ncbi:glycosyltransferase [Fibrobacter sp. UWB2]|uniref:glycosyltransferase n=1 Tax=Fibrobacter sp. UWB2 TaxID=1964358 RepID=UPI0013038C50|nr:glycosyltransferase [Fibrobacter sp. UWB2]